MTHYSPKAQMSHSTQLAPQCRAEPLRMAAPMRCAPALVLAVMTALAGCAQTPVVKSSVDVPAQYAAPADTVGEPEVAWWESYGDPVLSDLIKRAARENRDIKIAITRVRAARAGETISRSWLWPSIGVGASGTDSNTGYNSSIKQAVAPAADAKTLAGSLDVSWEIDISGRLRAGAAAAAADAMASEDTARGVRLLVLTDVASNYFTLVGALRQL